MKKLKKKILSIKLISGRTIERDLTSESYKITGIFDAPANDLNFAKLCQGICVNGYTDPDLVTGENYTHIAPSQIETVSLTSKD